MYQQTFVDSYSKVAFAKLYTTKTPITAADPLNDKALTFFAEQDLPMLRILTDRGSEYCGRAETHDYQLYLANNDIEHTKLRANRHKPMAFANGSTRAFCRSFSTWRCEKRF